MKNLTITNEAPRSKGARGSFIHIVLLYHNMKNKESKIKKDPDGDGYTNLEKYLAGTSPKDNTDHPAGIKPKRYMPAILMYLLN